MRESRAAFMIQGKAGIVLAALAVFLCALPQSSFAASAGTCIPGLPCNVPLTANDPANENDGPNVSGPNKDKTDSKACDADFMNQIYARAYLEASRETIYNDVVVRKPDSVMEYSCFDQFLKDTADFAGPLFSESTRWDGLSVPNPGAGPITMNVNLGDQHLDTALNRLVMRSLYRFVNSNFSHTFLGGALDENNTIASSVQSAASTCDFMDSIFYLAKCNDFGLDDPFLTFRELSQTDPRQLPSACPSPIPVTTAIIDIAENTDYAFAAFDRVQTFQAMFKGSDCQPPIPTGLQYTESVRNVDISGTVNEGNTDIIMDHVCPNPGCYFDGVSSCKEEP